MEQAPGNAGDRDHKAPRLPVGFFLEQWALVKCVAERKDVGEAQGVSRWPVHQEVTLQLWLKWGGAFEETFKHAPWTTFCSLGSAGHRRAILLCSEMLPAHLGPSPGKDRQVGPGPGGRGRGSLCSHGPCSHCPRTQRQWGAPPHGSALGKFCGGNKQSQFNSCYFGEHRPTWGAVYAATASIPHLSLGPRQRASFQLESLAGLP